MSAKFLENAWYAACWSDDVGQALFERTIIGESILLYRKRDGSAVAMGNACPHRFAPLDRGQLLDDVVECPYHGLRYDSSGACVHNPHGNGKVPQRARTSADTAHAIASRRARLRGEAEPGKGPVNLCPVERACQGWHALDIQAKQDSEA